MFLCSRTWRKVLTLVLLEHDSLCISEFAFVLPDLNAGRWEYLVEHGGYIFVAVEPAASDTTHHGRAVIRHCAMATLATTCTTTIVILVRRKTCSATD